MREVERRSIEGWRWAQVASANGPLRQNPNDADALAARAGALLGLGLAAEALADFEKRLQVVPQPTADLEFLRAVALQRVGQPQAAQVILDRLAAYSGTDSLELAVRHLARATDDVASGSSDETQWRLSLGLDTHGYARCPAEADQGLSGHPDSEQAIYLHSMRGFVHVTMGEFELAHSDFDAAIAVGPDATALNMRAWTGYLLGKPISECRRDVDRSLELRPKLAGSYHTRARLKWADGDLEGALQDLDTAFRAGGTNNPFYHEDKAEILEALGRPNKAAKERQDAAALKSLH